MELSILWPCMHSAFPLMWSEYQQHNKYVLSYGKNSPKFEFLSYSLTVRRIVLPRKLSFYPCIMWQGVEPTFCKIIGVKQTVPV